MENHVQGGNVTHTAPMKSTPIYYTYELQGLAFGKAGSELTVSSKAGSAAAWSAISVTYSEVITRKEDRGIGAIIAATGTEGRSATVGERKRK